MKKHPSAIMDLPARRHSLLPAAMALALAMLCLWAVAACSGSGAAGDSSDAGSSGALSGNLERRIGDSVPVGNAVITVRAFQDAFQPVSPAQKLSDGSPEAPAAGESFYQAYVRIENRGQVPLRVDPTEFACLLGDWVSSLEPTRSGPPARSLIYGTSIDLLLTFRGPTGQDPILIYTPSWYDGRITFSSEGEASAATTTTAAPETTTTTTVATTG